MREPEASHLLEAVRVDAEATRQRLLDQEDTDGDRRITIDDRGPRRFTVQALDGSAFEVVGTQRLASLLEELTLALEQGRAEAELRPDRIFENPVDRLSRRIREELWDNLTRRVDESGLDRILTDTKASDHRQRLYVPATDERAWAYFRQVAARRPELEVLRLPECPTPAEVRALNHRPGLLSLALIDDAGALRGAPFVVPGGRFNEMYGWDSYFEALGLLVDGRVDLARSMVDCFVYQIRHYGKILNANRTYYLTRSQPPFLTQMARAVYEHLPRTDASRQWLITALAAAIQEYRAVWTSPPRLTESGLSRYYGEGLGIPPETEPGHFAAVLAPYAARAGLDPAAYEAGLRTGDLVEPQLDAYFTHDRSVRESGHDTSYRLEGRAAHLLTVDLASLLYRYELDIAELLEQELGDGTGIPAGEPQHAATWRAQAEHRRQLVDDLLWDDDAGLYLDYDLEQQARTGSESATTLYPLWAGLASEAQAERLIPTALARLEAAGGLLAGSRASRGDITEHRPQRQWDYPFGWAPHQLIAWRGLVRYGHIDDARRLAYRWLDTIARNAAQYNGTVPEKYDVVRRTHAVFAEYGNVGVDFDYITREGFGWMNASFQVGLTLLTDSQRHHLRDLVPSEWLFGPAPAL